MKDLDVILPLIGIVILTLTLLKYLKPGNRNLFFIFIFSLLCVYIPSSSIVRHVYYIPLVAIMVILFIIALAISKISNRIKIVVALCVLLIYNRPVFLTCRILYSAIKIIRSNEKYPDSAVANIVNNIYTSCGIKIRTNFRTLTTTPTIFVANYCRDRMENPACILIPRNLAVIMHSKFTKINMSNIINKPIYVNGRGNGNFDNMCEKIKDAHNEGNDIFVYINSPSYFNYQNRHKSGIYHIAKKLHITITPLAIDYIGTKFGTIPNQKFYIESGDSFYVDNVNTAKYKARNFHIKAHKKFKLRKYKA